MLNTEKERLNIHHDASEYPSNERTSTLINRPITIFRFLSTNDTRIRNKDSMLDCRRGKLLLSPLNKTSTVLDTSVKKKKKPTELSTVPDSKTCTVCDSFIKYFRYFFECIGSQNRSNIPLDFVHHMQINVESLSEQFWKS